MESLFAHGHFFRNVAVLLTGTAVAQGITILASPVLTRLYSPGEFGVYALFMAAASLLAGVGGGRFEMAIVLPEKDENGMSAVAVTAFIASLLSSSLLMVAAMGHEVVARLLGAPALGPWLYAMPGFVFLSVSTSAIRYWFNRRKMYSRMASNVIWRATLTALLSIGFGLVGMAEGGLINGLILGQLLATFYFAYQLWRQDRVLLQGVRWRCMLQTALQYQDFPKYLVPSGLVESFSAQLPTFCLASLFGQSTVGLFALATRVVNLPFSLISSSVGDVFRQQASELYTKTGNCRPLFLQCTRHLLAISVGPFVGLFILAPWLFGWIFGAQWRPAGTYVQLMTVMFMIRFVTSPLSVMFYVAEKQKWDLVLQSTLLIIMAFTFWILGQYKLSVNTGIIAYSAVYSAKYIVEYYLSFILTIRKRPPPPTYSAEYST